MKADIQKVLKSPSGILKLDIQLTIEKGKSIALYGASGSGKTSILRMLSGLLQPDSGTIKYGHSVWYDSTSGIHLSPQRRKVGFVFQDYALFPNMSVYQNLKFALSKEEEEKRIDDLIEIMKLGDLRHAKPTTLSGGQKQRVALARTLVQDSEILLLDEPLSALDIGIRKELQNYLVEVQMNNETTIILASHDVGEILKMTQKVYCLEDGNLQKQGNPKEILINSSHTNTLTAEIMGIEKESSSLNIYLLLGENLITAQASPEKAFDFKRGDRVRIQFNNGSYIIVE